MSRVMSTDESVAAAAPALAAAPVTMAAALNRALADSLAADERVVVFGEDVGPLGGVFRVTDGLAARFGERRVFDTPLAEAGIVGTAIGMAMNGLVPVVEMQFDAFAYPAFEQVTSHLAKLHNRTRGQAGAAGRHPGPVRRRDRRGGAPQRLVRGVLHAHPGPAGGDAGHSRLTPTFCCGRRSRARTRSFSSSRSGGTGLARRSP